jgi:predicted ATP-grasp superfamily ATP-dependent carboligase
LLYPGKVMRCIVTFARSWSALAATRALGKRGVEVVTGDENPLAPAMLSRYSIAHFLHPNPDREPEKFLDTLEDVVRRWRPKSGDYVLMPIHKELYLISKHRKRFEPLIRLALPTIDQIEQVHDKGTLALYCRDQGIPSPRTAVPASVAGFREAAREFSYPAFVKVRRSASSVGVRKVESAEEAVATCDEFVETYRLGRGLVPLLQEAIPGEDYCATFLFDRGRPRLWMTYHNLRTHPPRSGTGCLRETVKAPAIEKIGRDLLAGLRWHGVAEIDFRWAGGTSEPKLIEVNPRFWGGLPQAVESGWDYPWLLFRLAADGKLGRVHLRTRKIRTETPFLAVLSTLHEVIHDEPRMEQMRSTFRKLEASYVEGNRRRALRTFFHDLKESADLRGRWRRVKALFRDHKGSVNDLFKWDDPLPFLGVLYPLGVFLRQGKVSTEFLVSEGRADLKDEPGA